MANRSGPSVYLAGPITGQPYNGAMGWREFAKQELSAAGITAFSPMRTKEYLSAEQAIDGNPSAYPEQILSRPKGIVTRDRFDTRTVDLVLMNLLPAEEEFVESQADIAQILLEVEAGVHSVGKAQDRVNALFHNGRGMSTLGTMIELGWADAFRTPVVAVMSESNMHMHPMVVEIAGYIVPTLEEALAITKSVLLP